MASEVCAEKPNLKSAADPAFQLGGASCRQYLFFARMLEVREDVADAGNQQFTCLVLVHLRSLLPRLRGQTQSAHGS